SDLALASAQQILAQREAEATASRRLAERGSIPKLQLDNVLSALAAARSQVEQAQVDLDRNVLHAPFDGVIDKVDVEIGSAVQAGAPVATILNLDPVLAKGEVSERDLGFLKPGDSADVRLVDGREVKGELSHISRDATSATRPFRVEIAIPTKARSIPAGMTAEITLRASPVD